MNLEELHGKTILLLGKSRALPADEFALQLKVHEITCVREYSDGVAYIIEGRMLNPIEQNRIDELYAQRAAPIVPIDELEQVLCSNIDGNRLMMGLKLSKDRERLLGYLQNPLIENTLFLKLLPLYDWQGEGFFENDENRDVTAALISRFYHNIDRNHNVQYANMGLMHLLDQTEDAELVETIAGLAPLHRALKEGTDNSTKKVLGAIAVHPKTASGVLNTYVRSGGKALQLLIAQRPDLDRAIQQQLFGLEDTDIHETLACNPSLSPDIVEILTGQYGEQIAGAVRLDDTLFERLIGDHTAAVAKNPSLTYAMQRKVYCYTDDIQSLLATNPSLDERMVQMLYETNKPSVLESLASNAATPAGTLAKMVWNKKLHPRLASNPSSSEETMKGLFATSEPAVLEALAKNPSTPAELLYQLQIDQRYARYVMENPGFGEHIQRENIGWL